MSYLMPVIFLFNQHPYGLASISTEIARHPRMEISPTNVESLGKQIRCPHCPKRFARLDHMNRHLSSRKSWSLSRPFFVLITVQMALAMILDARGVARRSSESNILTEATK